MNPEFWLGALRDLALLILGSSLTLLGVWLTNRATERRELRAEASRRELAAEERNRSAANNVRDLMFRLYIEARHWNTGGNTSVLRFDEATFHGAEMGAQLVRDREIRELLELAFAIARAPERGVEAGLIDETPPRAQTTAMYDAIALVSAHLRGDSHEGESKDRLLAWSGRQEL